MTMPVKLVMAPRLVHVPECIRKWLLRHIQLFSAAHSSRQVQAQRVH
jgi:hypothetical protein